MKDIIKILQNRAFLTIFLSSIILIILYFLPRFFIILDKKISYYYLNNYNESQEISKDIVMVELDDLSISQIGSYPFPRDVYATFLKNLKEKNPSVIAFDIIFSDKGPTAINDEIFGEEILKSGNVVLGSPITDDGRVTDVDGNLSILPPISNFLSGGTLYGYFPPNVNKITGESYSFIPGKILNVYIEEFDGKIRNGEKFFNHFTIEILKKFLHIDSVSYDDNGLNFVDGINIPYSDNINKEILVNYFPSSRFKDSVLSFSNIVNKELEYHTIDFEGKIVLVGATAKGLKDIFNTPNGTDFGVYIHANIINMILTGNYLVFFNKILELILIGLLTFIAVYFNLSKSNKVLIISNLLFLGLFVLLNQVLLGLSIGMFLNHPAYIVLAFILALILSNIAKYLTENKDKKRMVQALSEYISKDIAEGILAGKSKVHLEGERKRISIFFSDIEGFTTISEKMNPEELVVFLREYLGAMSNIIMDEKGLIDKYEGDAIMALWGVFGSEDSSTFDNCNSALKQQKELKRLNVFWKEKFNEELKIRMGLHTGEAIVGNIGATGRKMEFTALGDSVNLASRLEEVNKKYGTYLCVSQDIYNEQKDNFDFRYLDRIIVKGKTVPIGIYELISKKGEISDYKKDIVNGFNLGVRFYLKQEFKKASEIFDKLVKLGDKPSLTYSKRCLQFEINPPGKDWNGVWEMKSK